MPQVRIGVAGNVNWGPSLPSPFFSFLSLPSSPVSSPAVSLTSLLRFHVSFPLAFALLPLEERPLNFS